ncbi:MAG: ATP-binding protein [candidate division Zixibacteria bacterium]|nr:ATP-binding protein [candidate division Zixibacteria bacterium]
MMLRVRFYIFWFCLCLFLAGLSPAADRPAFTLKQVDARPGIAAFEIGDIDGDGRIEAIELAVDHHAFFARELSHEEVIGPALFQANSQFYMNFVKPIEIDATPGMELAIAYKDLMGDSAWLCIVAGTDKERILCRTEAVRGVNLNNRGGETEPSWNGSISQCLVADINRDGVPEIVLSVGVGFDLYPRGVYVYQYPSGLLLWRFLTAGNPNNIVISDANGDGFTETFFKTSATSNGAIVDDQSDTTADIFALDHTGRQIWRTGTGDRFEFSTSNIQVCDCDKDNVPEIYYSTMVRTGDLDRQVQVLEKHRASDNLFLQQRPFDAPHRFQQIMVGAVNNDSLTEILLNNGPSILNPVNLTTISEGPVPRSDIAYVGDLGQVMLMPNNPYVGDLTGGALVSGIILKAKDSLFIMDGGFRLLAVYGADYGRQIGAVKYFHSPVGGDYLGMLVSVGEAGNPGSILYVLAITPAEAAAVSAWWSGGRAPWAIVVVAFLLGIPTGILLHRVITRKPRSDANHLAVYEDLLSVLTAFGHGQAAGRNLTRLGFLFSNLPEAPKKIAGILPNIQSAVETYRSLTADQLDAIAGNGRRIRDLRSIIHELTNHTKQLNAFLRGSTPKLLSIDDLARLKVVVPRTIESIRQVIKRLEMQIKPIFGSDLIKVIPGVLISIAAIIREYNVKISQVVIVGDYRHLAYFPPTELAVVMDELITNACRAMKDAAVRHLSFRLEYTVDQVIIDVSDTGAGIAVDDPEVLFSREFSTKGPEGGFGLFHARQRIEHFGGKIRIHNNADGPGATVRMVFKGIPRE